MNGRKLFLVIALLIAGLAAHLTWGEFLSRDMQQESQALIPKEQGKIRAQVNEVTTPVTVVDKKHNFILDLTEKVFTFLITEWNSTSTAGAWTIIRWLLRS